jgi:hypothetical protein
VTSVILASTKEEQITADMRNMLCATMESLKATKPSVRSKWLTFQAEALVQKSLVHMRHSEAAWGEALYHHNRRNEQLHWMYTPLNESWISTSFQLPDADEKLTKELKTICSGLRFESIEPKEKMKFMKFMKLNSNSPSSILSLRSAFVLRLKNEY